MFGEDIIFVCQGKNTIPWLSVPTNCKLQVLERLYTHRIVNKQRYYGIKL